MKIEEVWDKDRGRVDALFAARYPYVWNVGGGFVLTRYGRVEIPYGFFWDGDSAVIDTSPIGSGVHDLIYLRPEVIAQDGSLRRLTLWECDRIYAGLQLTTRHPFIAVGEVAVAGVRFIGLEIANRIGVGPWKRYRARESRMGREAWAEYVSKSRVLPNASQWQLPTTFTRDAFWTGDA
jgi:hypothetical protein